MEYNCFQTKQIRNSTLTVIQKSCTKYYSDFVKAYINNISNCILLLDMLQNIVVFSLLNIQYRSYSG